MVDVGSSSDSDKLSQKLLAIAAGEAHTLALTGDGCVFSWGRGTFGRLGTGKEEDEIFPVQIEFDSLKKSRVYGEEWKGKRPKFVEIAAGAYHSLALEDDGSVWCWGYNTYGQLGLNMENSSVPCFLERFVELGSHDSLTEESNTKVRSIKAGGMMSLAIDNLGALWMWGNCPQQTSTSNREFSLVSSFTPIPVWDFHGHVVVKVACGNEHVVALVSAEETFTGNNLICYSWGNNNRGQLGLGDTESRFRPELLETFDHKSVWAVYEVACGSFHTALLARKKSNGGVIGYTDPTGFEENGTMCWTFGLGENGQLGHGTTNSICLPEPVEQLPRDVFLISVDCGLFHTSVVSSTGDVWSWGMEKGLGLCPDASFTGTDTGDALSPLRIPCDEYYGPKFAGPVQVACGAAHTVLIANNGYKLWAWGRGRSGVLGRGNILDSFAPCSVMWPPLNEDFQEELKTVDRKAGVEDRAPTFQKKEDRAPTFQKKEDRAPEKVMESSAIEELQLLRSKLALMERYTAVLHGSIFGKPFQMNDMPPSLQESAFFDIAKEWENILESADNEHLIRMEIFYRKMLANVKDKLMKRRIQELINECLHSSKTKT